MKAVFRTPIYRAEKAAQHLRFASLTAPHNGWPALLGISFPKSGTHLLDQILLGFSAVAPFSKRLHSFYAEYEGESGAKRAPETALEWLDALGACDIASAHLFARPAAVERVCSEKFVPYFIFRDPRDVAVSHVFYVTEMESHHVHHKYYASLSDFDARLEVSILGRPDADVEFPDIAQRFAPYLGWLDQPAVLKIHFEDLIQDRHATLDKIIERFLGRAPLPIPPKRIRQSLGAAIDPAKSPTFRSGRSGEWKKYFNEEHKRLFKERAGQLLIRLGYEKDLDW